MGAHCVSVADMCVAPAYAPAVELRGYMAASLHPDSGLAAARQRVGASIEALYSDCIQCEDLTGYDVRCRGQACVAVGSVARTPTSLSLGFTAVRRGERLDHQGKLDLVIKAASPERLQAAIAAVALQTSVRGVAIPLRGVLSEPALERGESASVSRPRRRAGS